MTIGRKLHTTRCHKPVSIGDAWLRIEHIYTDEDGKGAVVAYRDPARPSPGLEWSLRGACVPLGERREMLEGVHVTIHPDSIHSWVRLTIEAPKSVPITDGFPRERNQPASPTAI
ncbi:hypothetical protein [Methylobacterium radiotolerans]